MSQEALSEAFRAELTAWAKKARGNDRHYLSKGYQGQVLLYKHEHHPLVLKVPPRWWPYSWLSRRMLQREALVYEKLKGLEGIPRCYGLLDGQFLVLDFIDGPSLRKAHIQDRNCFYSALLRIIRKMHVAGVGHADLKRKDNILVGPGEKPFVIDFGVATLRQSGWHPINQFLFNTARRFDLNAWVKHKYRRQLHDVSAVDAKYLHRTWMELTGRRIKRIYRKVIKRKRLRGS